MPRSHLTLLLLLTLTGCSSMSWSARRDYKYDKPALAVITFENRSNAPLNWKLGESVAELLSDSLYRTGQFRVLEREHLDAVMKEQQLQSTGITRAERKVPANRLKNARYLVKGSITEFANVNQSGLDLGVGSLRIGGGGMHAVVSIALKVTEVESGEILFSQVVTGKTYIGETAATTNYKNVTFGGTHFFQTPLGEALREALDEGVSSISEVLGHKLWQPTIASVDGRTIMLSGGKDRKMKIGSRWHVRKGGEMVRDPETGDLLGRSAGDVVGTLLVLEVADRYSVASILDGKAFERGQKLELISGK